MIIDSPLFAYSFSHRIGLVVTTLGLNVFLSFAYVWVDLGSRYFICTCGHKLFINVFWDLPTLWCILLIKLSTYCNESLFIIYFNRLSLWDFSFSSFKKMYGLLLKCICLYRTIYISVMTCMHKGLKRKINAHIFFPQMD